MRKLLGIAALLLLAVLSGLAQAATPEVPALPEPDITGMYSFLHEGEFVQIEVTGGQVTGLISFFKNEKAEAAEFEDRYFETASLKGNTLMFATKDTGGIWFEFSGTVERGPARTPEEEGYWIIRGTLIEHRKTKEGAADQKSQKLDLRSFPQDAPPAAPGGEKK